MGGGGQGSLDDNDYALRGGKHQNDYILLEYFYITNFQSFSKNFSFNELHVAYDT